MPEVNWQLGLSPDIGGTFMAAYDQGRQRKKQEMGQNALAAYAQNPNEQSLNALAQYAPEFALQEKQRMSTKQHEEAMRRAELIGQAALAADTPEKWDTSVDYLARLYPDLAQYKGQFSMREAAIAAAGQMKAYLDQNKPVNMAPGNRLVDPTTGRIISEAPFAPHYSTVSEGQTVVRDQPGLSVDTFLPAIVAQESGGNYSARNAESGALGAYQVMPQTGASLAQRLGLPWQPELMTADTPQARQYQDAIGRAAVEEAVNASGGDPAVAAAYYHGGSDRSKWGPRTQKYAGEVVARLGGGAQVVAQGAPKQPKGQWRTLSPQEAQQMGLPAGTYQQSPDGEVKPIGGVGDKAPQSKEAYSQSAMDAFNRAIESANRLLKHPGFSTAVGVKGLTGGLLGGWVVPGTDAADFKAELDAMKAQVFLPMVQSMKGMGALSNAEGEKLTASIGALDASMSENGFKASLNRIIRDLQSYRDRASTPAQQSTRAPAARSANTSDDALINKYLNGGR